MQKPSDCLWCRRTEFAALSLLFVSLSIVKCLCCVSAHAVHCVALFPSCRLLENSAILDQYERASVKYENMERRFTPAWQTQGLQTLTDLNKASVADADHKRRLGDRLKYPKLEFRITESIHHLCFKLSIVIFLEKTKDFPSLYKKKCEQNFPVNVRVHAFVIFPYFFTE